MGSSGNVAISRRAFVGRIVGPTVLLLTAACSSQAPVQTSSPTAAPAAAASTPPAATAAQTRAGSPLPTFIASQAVKADLPPPVPGVDAGYLAYPRSPAPSVTDTAGSGGVVTIMSWQYTPPVAALDQNTALQELNKRIGAELHLQLAPISDYPQRLATLMAGNDLPDIMYLNAPFTTPGQAQFLKNRCVDLTQYLAGDAIGDYPNLAAMPTPAWKGALYGDALYGVPVVYSQLFRVLWTHQELLDQAGASMPRDTDDLKRILQLVTNPQAGQWGLGVDPQQGLGIAFGLEGMWFGAPNNWMVDASGKFTKDRESDAYKAAVAYTRDLYAAGVLHPNSVTGNNAQGKTDFAGRKVVFRWDGAASSVQFWDQSAAADPPGKLRIAPPFTAPGTKPTYPLGLGQMGFSAFKQASPDRIRELLRILNFLAAPFGTQEHLLINYGLPGVHHTIDANGNPILTDKGTAEITPSWSFVVRPTPVLFNPKSADFARVLQADQTPNIQAGQADASLGLYSETQSTKAALAEQPFLDGLTDVVLGRRPLADFDQLVKDWQNAGGNQIRTELERAYAAAKG
jgi:putative aldouronate transport system substrate-binding protein